MFGLIEVVIEECSVEDCLGDSGWNVKCVAKVRSGSTAKRLCQVRATKEAREASRDYSEARDLLLEALVAA